jgi:hypothetical protein
MAHKETHDLSWRKATASNGSQGCVEVANLPDGGVELRDSKHPDGPRLRFTAHEWDCFLDGVTKGEFHHGRTLAG